jgi:DNA polymerase III delta prime subunit
MEINAPDKNGIENIRELLEVVKHMPHSPSISKVIIMDEAHQLTTQAQNALLKITEDSPKYFYLIFCTTEESKIITPLKRRAYILHSRGIDQEATNKLLTLAKNKTGFKGDIKELEEELVKYDINSPGLILQAAEKYFAGADPMDCIFNITEASIDTKQLCSLMSKGAWKEAIPIIKMIKKENIVLIRLCILGYFKAILINSGSITIAKAIKIIAEECYDLPVFIANLRIACDVIKN